jgi:hypothetical protein
MTIPRSVTAKLVERYIFNFRLRPDALAESLPVPWLKPQVINGWSVASFCVLSLEQVMLAPLPGALGYKTLSCAYRCGVIDHSGPTPEPSVYILDRNTDLPIIARLGTFVFADTIPLVHLQVDHVANDNVEIRVRYMDRQRMFSATVMDLRRPAPFSSKVFDSVAEYASFIHFGVSSYTPSIFGDELAKVDLYKEDPIYEPLNTTVDFDWLESQWRDAGLEFDCAVRATTAPSTQGSYRWTYRGTRAEET